MIKWFAKKWLGGIRYWWSKQYRAKRVGKYSDIALPEIKCFRDIFDALRQIKYEPDRVMELFDAIESPEQVWAERKADCDGFSVLAAELMKKFEPRCKPVLLTIVFNDFQKSHTVCAYRALNNWKIFRHVSNWDNCDPQGNFYSYQHIVNKISKRVGSNVICWDVVDHKTLDQKEFHVAGKKK